VDLVLLTFLLLSIVYVAGALHLVLKSDYESVKAVVIADRSPRYKLSFVFDLEEPSARSSNLRIKPSRKQ